MALITPIKNIGNGPAGGKSQGLAMLSKEFGDFSCPLYGDKRLSVKVPPFIPLTPLLCDEIAKKAGCSMEDGPISAKEKIMNSRGNLLQSSMGEIYNIAYKLKSSQTFAFRSDDAGFSGIMPTVFADANFNRRKASIVGDFSDAAAEVISGRFSEEAKIAREIFPSWSGGGVMAMPYYGGEMTVLHDFTFQSQPKKYAAPSLAASFVSPAADSDYYRWQFFRGISAFPSPKNLERFNGLQVEFAAYTCMDGGELHALSQVQTSPFPLGLRLDGEKPRISFFQSMMHAAMNEEDLVDLGMGLNTMAMQIKDAFGKAYLELLCPFSKNPFEWLFMQFSDLGFINSERPKAKPYGDGWASTAQVAGFADKACRNVNFAGRIPSAKDREFNKANKNYLLVINAISPFDLQDNWRLPDFSNAGAIAMVVNGRMHPAVSHMGGLMLMMGLPVLVYDEMGGRGAAEQIMSLPRNAECRVIADEAEPIGGIKKTG